MLSNLLSEVSPFIQREDCPICMKQGELIVEAELCHPRLMSWITEKYRNRVPLGILKQGSYSLYLCRHCNFLYQGAVLCDQWLSLLYETWVDPKESLLGNQSKRSGKVMHSIRSISMLSSLGIQDPRQIRVLDFGAGWGTWAQVAELFGYQVDVCEVSPARQAYLRTKGMKIVSIDDISALRESYSFVHAEQVFEHLTIPRSMMERLVTFLKPGGTIDISVPDTSRLHKKTAAIAKLNVSDADLKLIAPFEHVNAFTHKSLSTLAETVGLKHIWLRPLIADFSKGMVRGVASWILSPYRKTTYQIFVKP